MTVMSWLIIFIYSLKSGGSVINGFAALIGISAAHLATNLLDDYFDYKTLTAKGEFIKCTQKSKCNYIIEGKSTLNDLLLVIIIYCAIAVLTGIFLTFRAGVSVIVLAVIGGLITLLYSRLSSYGFSELAVGTAFGPLLFEGVYYVMTGHFSFNVFILSIAVVMFTVGLLYTHTLLDYDGDLVSHKKTLCCRIGNKKKALSVLLYIYAAGYLITLIYSARTGTFLFLLTFATIPWVILLNGYMKSYFADKKFVPEINWYNYPLDKSKASKNSSDGAFCFRLYQARNIMVYYTSILCVLLLFS